MSDSGTSASAPSGDTKSIKIKAGEHISVLGITGSGKTYFADNGILPLYTRIIVIDTEGLQFEHHKRVSVNTALRLSKGNTRFHVRIEMSGDFEQDSGQVNRLCEGLLKHGHDLAIYFDETTDYSDAAYIPPRLQQLIRKARKRNISVIVGTQRPQLLNKTYMANCIHQFTFALGMRDENAVHKYDPTVTEHTSEIPYGSHKCIYVAPDKSVTIIEPVRKHTWAKPKRKLW